jgi:hypothetical protein
VLVRLGSSVGPPSRFKARTWKGHTVKAATVVGILLVIIGVVALIYGGISYTKEETVLDIGPLEARTRTRETIPLPPLLGGLALAGGIVLLVVGARKR